MDCTASFLSYQQTGYFSKIVLDYIKQEQSIQPFYRYPASIEGIQASITYRKKFATNRSLLVSVLQQQYADVEASEKVAGNIKLLQNENTFTICTAHQPNIFTGPLYFIYKILHAIKLAEQWKTSLPEYNFVPVYYMGSEDADLEELGHFYISGQKYEWETPQTGAVGRMKVDKALVNLLDTVSGQLLVYPYGAEIVGIMKECYTEGATIEQATFRLVNNLFADYGLIVLLPDNADLKASFIPVIEKELLAEFSHPAVQETVTKFSADYKVQASGRELNMFYLKDDKRERIEMTNGIWSVVNTELKFTREEIIAELKQYPERFSPNVILRPVFQEWILPNIAFIGGGGEIAYWLQLKKVFEAVETPYPVLVVRNSFMLISEEVQIIIDKLKFSPVELFQSEIDILNRLVKRDSWLRLSLGDEQQQLADFYEQLKILAGKIDITLMGHTAALQTQALKKLASLEKKMLRAEKKKFEAQQRQLQKIKTQLFPNNNLQERVDNGMFYYAKWGKGFIRMIYDHSKGLEQEFGVLTPGP
ncbi:MAG: bacillithiol biosynthesis cysteine-adding enzyme BshC [Ferruginibacter sp.]|nr:bacillithiol biosynthesis cysteine-adding enzyme BshC [Ferruginibacter sp.]